jgi:tRNA-dihydrouridine synthase B
MILSGIRIPNLTVLAPMAGVTDSPYRRICRELGAGLVFSEMISADALARNQQATLSLIRFRSQERPIGIQIFGSDPKVMADAAERLLPIKPDFIDLNFGCPVRKVVNRGAGSALLKDLDAMAQIARAVVKVTPIPVLAKIRSGWLNTQTIAAQAAQMLEDCGVAGITLHPRSRCMAFTGNADWEIIGEIKRLVSIPVIGNGDIKSAEDTRRMIAETNCDLVMIGRAVLGNPWIFAQSNAVLNNQSEFYTPTLREKVDMCIRHLRDEVEWIGEYRAVRLMRKHIGWYLKGAPNSSKIRQELYRFTRSEEIECHLLNFLQRIESGDHPI